MNLRKPVLIPAVLLVILLSSVGGNSQTPLGTSFTYQGRLSDGGVPAEGVYDLRFVLYDSAAGGSQIGPVVTVPDHTLAEGLFAVELDFGAEAFTGEARWLEIRVRPGSETGAFSILNPRLTLTPAPHSIYAATAGSVSWQGLIDIPAGFADGVDHTNDTVQFSEIEGIIGDGPEQVAAGNHDHDSRYYLETELSTSGSASVHWDNLISVPSGFADGVDNTNDSVQFSEIEGIIGDGPAQVAAGNHDHDARYYIQGDTVHSATTLVAGAVIEGPPSAWDGWVLRVNMTGGAFPSAAGIWTTASTGPALYGDSAGGYGIYGYSENGNAVVASSSAKTAGVFHSEEGCGVFVSTYGTNHWDHGGYFHANSGYGIFAHSNNNNAIRAEGGDITGVWTPGGRVGVVGLSGSGRGVYGSSRDDAGVVGTSVNHYGVYANSEKSHGIYARSSATSALPGYAGYFYSTNYRGLYATGHENFYAGYFTNPQGSTGPGLYVNGTLYTTGSKSGYVVDVALSEGPELLETGDVVVITGAGEPVCGEIPVIRVRKATEDNTTGIAGVVDQPLTFETSKEDGDRAIPRPARATASLSEGTPIGAGEYLNVVTLGAFKAVKVDASFGAIRPGDLLVASSNPGYAMRSEDPKMGAVIGKALGELTEGTGMVPVLVTLQ